MHDILKRADAAPKRTSEAEIERRTRRDEVWRLLQGTIHYARCAQMHLEADDDPVALYDLRSAREYFIRAIQMFEPLKRGIAERIVAEAAP